MFEYNWKNNNRGLSEYDILKCDFLYENEYNISKNGKMNKKNNILLQ